MNRIIQFPFAKKQMNCDNSPFYLQLLITKYKARKEAKRIVKSMCEVEDFESGKKQPKSFDDFLKEL